ncbi:unnamed protein product [Polarella glacialis]|uniref:NADAR domain-containing protein n=1 Tax=Polarella glacialis TaxID=89957 RepID=A0A813F0N0_POLGL|nr:unnamed protein product [Polarella glacialis]
MTSRPYLSRSATPPRPKTSSKSKYNSAEAGLVGPAANNNNSSSHDNNNNNNKNNDNNNRNSNNSNNNNNGNNGNTSSEPVCCRPGCGRLTWNGQRRQYCSACQDQEPTTVLLSMWNAVGYWPASLLQSWYNWLASRWMSFGPQQHQQQQQQQQQQQKEEIRMSSLQPSKLPFSILPLDALLQTVHFGAANNNNNYNNNNNNSNVGLVAFYFPGHEERWDTVCGSSFLSNFYDLSYSGGLHLKLPHLTKPTPTTTTTAITTITTTSFRTAEGAYQALKFGAKGDLFRTLSGEEAFRLSRSLAKHQLRADFGSSGFRNSWQAMFAVLRCKFNPGSECAKALVSTDRALLLEHNSCRCRDALWSDNGDGTGLNWLGLQLILIRDELRCQQEGCSGSWTLFLRQEFDLLSGQPLASNNAVLWRQMVHKAAHELEQLLHATYSNNDNYNNNNSRNNSSSSNSTSQNSAASWEEQNLRASPVSSLQPCRKIVWRGPILLTGGALLLLFLILRTLRPDRITAMMKSVADLVCAACAPVIHPLQVLRSCMKPILEIEHDLQELMYTNDATSHFSNYNNNNDDELTATNPELEACWQNEMA